ncbi:energy-coupling factor transporter transmembrane protein EcfT [Microbacterium lushaniae]|nr:energy-coupling factor transporter transmembrane protein EcfT [Microbacterium lushaniae]KAA9155468.1 energy-coupling factor transporter transmembrane protein EcfT [Microbacterium lushaniae]
MSGRADPYAAPLAAGRLRFLSRLNPLAKLAAPLPAIVLLLFARDLVTPLAFLVLGCTVLLVGAPWTRRLGIALGVVVPLGVVAVGLTFSLWTDASRVDDTAMLVRLGGWTWYAGALESGFSTALRLAAILVLIGGMTTTGPDLVRALVQQLRVPYRIGYTALAAFRFVPRFGYELDVIRQAHRVRGAHGGRGPFAAVARWIGYMVPLLASAIRHAERVALAMDARAFGAYPDRTERHVVPFRTRDAVFVAIFWVVTVALFWAVRAAWSA